MKLIGVLFIIAGILGALYIGIWWGIVEPIMHIASAYDTGQLTGMLVAKEVIKFLLKEILATGCMTFCWFIGMGLITGK